MRDVNLYLNYQLLNSKIDDMYYQFGQYRTHNLTDLKRV